MTGVGLVLGGDLIGEGTLTLVSATEFERFVGVFGWFGPVTRG